MTILEETADILDAGAKLFLPQTANGVERRAPISNADFDRDVIIKSLGTERPAMWINEMTYTYVLESSHELTALAILLRAHHVAGAVEPIVRAVVERAGRVIWVLDGGSQEERDFSSAGRDFLDVRRRTIRACVELLVCLQHTRRAAKDLEPKKLGKLLEEQLRTDRSLVGEWFTIDQPPENQLDPNLGLDPEIAHWTIGGEKYPGYGQLAHLALNEKITRGRARGLYSALSGWSHPNFLASRIHNGPGDTYIHSIAHLKDLLEVALLSYANELLRITEYFDANRDLIGAELDGLFDRWYEVTAQVDRAPDAPDDDSTDRS
jgi:hypothetical protein